MAISKPLAGKSSPKADPEAQLSGLARAMERLVRAAAVLPREEDHKLREDLVNLARRVVVSEVLAARPTVVVAGLQGVGKSTLVAALYDLPDGVLPENLGRGEQIPVLITERRGATAPGLFSHEILRAEVGPIVGRRAVTAAEFHQIARAPSGDDLYLEIESPPRWLGGSDAALLLLPGVEDTPTEWDVLARHAMDSGSACVYVVDGTRLAWKAHADLFGRVLDGFGLGKLVVALSRTDMTLDGNDAAFKRLVEMHGIPAEAHERILRTGTSPELVAAWTKDLARILGRILPPTKQLRARQLEQLRLLVDDDLGRVLGQTEDALHALEARAAGGHLAQVEAVLVVVQEERQRVRKAYAAAVNGFFAAHAEAVQERMAALITKPDWFDRAWSTLFGEPLEEALQFEGALKLAWRDPALRDAHARAIADVVRTRTGLLVVDAAAPSAYALAKPEAPLPSLLSGDVVSDIRVFAGDRHLTNTGHLPSLSAKESLRVLPSAALDYARLVQVAPQSFATDGKPPSAGLEVVANDFTEAVAGQKQLFQIVGGLLVADAAWDGKLDSLPNLAHALGFAGPATTGTVVAATAAGPIAIAAGVVAAGAAVVVIRRAIIGRDYERYGSVKLAVHSMRESSVQQTLDAFDDLMDALEERVTFGLERLYGLDAAWARNQRLALSLHQAVEQRLLLLDAIDAQRLFSDVG